MVKTIWNKDLKIKKEKKKKPSLHFTTLHKKYEAGLSLFKYEEKYLEKKLIEQCDTLRSKIVRYRDTLGVDEKQGFEGVSQCNSYMSCTGCFKQITFKTCHACHVIDRGRRSHRRDLRNGYACCPICNNPLFNAMDHKMMLVAQINKIHGPLVFGQMRESRNKIKPDLKQLYLQKELLASVLATIPVDTF